MRLIVLFSLKAGVSHEDYQAWALSRDLPTVRALPSIAGFTEQSKMAWWNLMQTSRTASKPSSKSGIWQKQRSRESPILSPVSIQ